jgi:hypothetical protein
MFGGGTKGHGIALPLHAGGYGAVASQEVNTNIAG